MAEHESGLNDEQLKAVLRILNLKAFHAMSPVAVNRLADLLAQRDELLKELKSCEEMIVLLAEDSPQVGLRILELTLVLSDARDAIARAEKEVAGGRNHADRPRPRGAIRRYCKQSLQLAV